MLFGEANQVEDADEKLRALEVFTERLTPGRWQEVRETTDQELKATTIVWMDIDEGAAKVRAGGPVDDEPDYDLDVWAGVVPVSTVIGAPIPDDRLKPGTPEPGYLKQISIGEIATAQAAK